ncbi:flagellar hook-length control protein FliK [Stenotrophomonas sp. LMG 10879]|uniref:flagellar hook-length control protein FliK n=1 Tax=Stenotrophomonas sp. LMG 10879 TaxID=487706 RepID=UPI000C17DC72|nr:flagellar hook-length control protein FliK [Stenotrophomonas sp. LMG 10879]PII21533.1 flagellar hook-length control protein FliK [Stenotrophomonas sp. LMG 10879]
MPSPLSSNASAPTPGGSGNASSTRTSSTDSGKDFGQMLQGGSASTATTGAAATASSPAKPANATSTSDGNPGKATPRPADGETAATDATTSTPAVPATSAAADDKDAPASADDAPWPPLGLAGLMLAVPTGVDPTPALPPPTASDAEALPSAAPALPAAAVAANVAQGAAAPATSASASAGGDAEASGLPLPELVLGGKALDRADDGDSLQIGDRAPPAPLQPPLPAALQDLKAALASNAVFNGEPTPKPVLGDDGFDQAIGARIGWLADQKIGHAHIRLNPEDLGPVDVRLQMNGDKVHASFSSPHVDVRQALESSLPRLRELLGEQGFQLAHADVGQQHSGDGNPGSQTAGGGRGGDGEPSLGDATVSASQLIRQRGLLDAYA